MYFLPQKFKTQKQNKRKPDVICCEFRSVTSIRTAAERKNNFWILGLLFIDLIAREGNYHFSCSVHFTRSWRYTKNLNFKHLKKLLNTVHSLRRMMEDVLKNINMTLKVCTKNNLTRNIGNTFRNKFILGNVDRISIDVICLSKHISNRKTW